MDRYNLYYLYYLVRIGTLTATWVYIKGVLCMYMCFVYVFVCVKGSICHLLIYSFIYLFGFVYVKGEKGKLSKV